MSFAIILALIGVAIAVGLGAIGSCFGVARIASTGAGLLAKEPEKFPQVLALCALPSTQSLYGLLFGFIVLIRIGLLGGTPVAFDQNVGLAFLFSSLPVGIACLFSGITQGQAGSSGVRILAQKPENFTQAIVLCSLIESFAIFGLVISLLIVFVGIKI
jgi:V/A-type H+-transporting ATPase subunit K